MTLIKRYPVLAYAGLTLGTSYLLWTGILLVAPVGSLMHNPPPAALALAALGGLVPSLMGLALTAVVGGRAGLRELWARLTRWRIPPAWYLVIAVPYVLNGLNYVLQGWLRPGTPAQDVLGRLGPALGLGLFAGLSEELGWRGFAQQRLQQRMPPLRAGLLVGLVWALWHTFANYTALGDAGWWFIPIVLCNALVLLVAFAVLQAWLYAGSGNSLLLAVLFHAAISSSAFALGRQDTTPQELLLSALVMAGLTVLAAGLIALAARRTRRAAGIGLANSPLASGD